MARRADPLLPLKGAQARAAAPQAHVWLSASAGTGKTHVLTARVFRLLLGGVTPENILCLTFTKAGASEMAERIHSRLAAWVQMSDADLALDLKALGEDVGPEIRERARRLFARVLEATGGGLAIQTIHSFCQQLLASFPLEAGLVPGFRALEESEQQALARLALEELVLDAEAHGEQALMQALHALALRLGEAGAEAYLRCCGRAHDAFADLPDDLRGWLFAALDLPQGDIEEAIAAACADDAFDVGALHRLSRANAEWGTKTGLACADTMARWLGCAPPSRAAMLEELGGCFLTAKGEPRAIQKGQEKAEPDYAALATRMSDAIGALLALRARAAYAEDAAQGLYAGRAYARAYEAAKRRRGAVDFDDLIAHGAALLSAPGIAEWVRYKLDARIDHILVDEAQDTNARQWTIIGALVEEFFTGEGARGDRLRTLFTVGDFKQAIFGFQGTSPQAFREANATFRTRAAQVGHDFLNLSLDESYRSTPAVLEVVDACVAVLGTEAFGLPEQPVHHESRNRYPGHVRLLKPVSAALAPADEAGVETGEAEGEEDWLSDQDRLLAERIARQIRAWLDDGMMLASKGRLLAPGDIMILLRRRGDLARLIVARLYEAGVPVAGVDRLRLQAPLGVQDLVAALRFAAQPEDDLALACLLVSPLIGWSQKELWQRAVPRRGSLWRHLRESPLIPAQHSAVLYDILARADFITPYRLLEHILSGPMQGRRRLLSRLGHQARDSIEELLTAALHFEQQEQ
ncbi:MAG: UvrD-helicase domain-containing protein, partial [Sphingomonadaceae bacterium]|nr:UvrD-helicase domain-containing protein [Sphingomonadaceae bacterium]